MYNKKCKNTFLFLMALLCLITLIVPFMKVGFFDSPNVFLKIIYYFTIVIFSISLVAIIIIGVYSLFRNNFLLISIQEIFAYLALFMLLVNLLIFSPISNAHLSVGFSILTLETFIMACFNDILKLIRKIPRTINTLSKEIHEKRKENFERKLIEENKQKSSNEFKQSTFEDMDFLDKGDEEVKIIPPDDEMI